MRLLLVFCATLQILTSCSSNQKIPTQHERIPFENLQMIRVIPNFIVSELQQKELWKLLEQELQQIGPVHTPQDTSLDRLAQEEKKPFSILIIHIGQIASIQNDTLLPVICVETKLLEKTTLDINQHEWMSTVWETTSYVEMTTPEETLRNLSFALQAMTQELAKHCNKAASPVFYLSNPIK